MSKNDFIWVGVFASVLIALACSVMTCRSEKDKAETAASLAEANIEAATDTIAYLRDDLGRETALRSEWQVKASDFDKIIKDKDLTIEALQKQTGKTISHAVYVCGAASFDTVYVKSDGHGHFRLADQWHTLEGVYDSAGVRIDKDSVPVSLLVGITDDGKVAVKTDNPYVSISELQGADVSAYAAKIDKKKNWGVGVTCGLAAGIGAGGPFIGPAVVIGMTKNFFRWGHR